MNASGWRLSAPFIGLWGKKAAAGTTGSQLSHPEGTRGYHVERPEAPTPRQSGSTHRFPASFNGAGRSWRGISPQDDDNKDSLLFQIDNAAGTVSTSDTARTSLSSSSEADRHDKTKPVRQRPKGRSRRARMRRRQQQKHDGGDPRRDGKVLCVERLMTALSQPGLISPEGQKMSF